MKLSPQKRRIYEIHKDGEWHCSTEIEYIRDHRKRVSEMNRDNRDRKGDDLFESERCDGSPKSCKGKHISPVYMRRLKVKPRTQHVTFKEVGGERIAVVSYL